MPGGLQPSTVHCSQSGQKLKAAVVSVLQKGLYGKGHLLIYSLWGGKEGNVLECSELGPAGFLNVVPIANLFSY